MSDAAHLANGNVQQARALTLALGGRWRDSFGRSRCPMCPQDRLSIENGERAVLLLSRLQSPPGDFDLSHASLAVNTATLGRGREGTSWRLYSPPLYEIKKG